jgi:hypothetical protein
MGFRLTSDGRTLADLPDHEPSLGVNLRQLEPDWMSGYRVAEGADVLLHDAQYSDHEYGSRVGWGHSTIDHAVAFADAAQANHLVMFHHDPAHSDVELESLLDHARSAGTGGCPPSLAAEGMTIELGSAGVVFDAPSPAEPTTPRPQ